jgi:hypothetical protein
MSLIDKGSGSSNGFCSFSSATGSTLDFDLAEFENLSLLCFLVKSI